MKAWEENMTNATIGGCSCGDDGEKKETSRGYLGDAVAKWEAAQAGDDDDDE